MLVGCSLAGGRDECAHHREGGAEALECQFDLRFERAIRWAHGLAVELGHGLDDVQPRPAHLNEQAFSGGEESVADFLELLERCEFRYRHRRRAVPQLGVELVLLVGRVGGDRVAQCLCDLVGRGRCEGVQSTGDDFQPLLRAGVELRNDGLHVSLRR
ncbi:hypothetical protein ACH51_08380 [Ralstonia solanacearum]|nr:hypothetical protein ACH51_08380 [Ralstonia solanacearum]